MQRPLKIGTRGSPLALYQARLVQSILAKHHGIENPDSDLPICIHTTSGDKLKGDLSEFGGKGLFTKELEDALASAEIDIAVHSMKDVPTRLQSGHVIGAVLEREDPRDAFISPRYKTIENLPIGAKIGTASLRRRAQLASMRPDVTFTLLRGNVGTRIKKLEAGECDATFLAYAGLKRLGHPEIATQIIATDMMLSAPSQAAIGLEILEANQLASTKITPLNHRPTQVAITAERAFLRALDGSCRTPIAALAEIRDGKLYMRGERLADDGQKRWSRDGFVHGATMEKAAELGEIMGWSILKDMSG